MLDERTAPTRNERHHATIPLSRIGQYRTGASDNPFKLSRGLIGMDEGTSRLDIRRSIRIVGQHGGNAVALFVVKESADKRRKIEKTPSIVLGCINQAG